MTPGTAEEDRLPPRSENQGFRRNYFNFFGNPLTPNSSKFEISPKFCEAFFNPVKFRQIFIKICSKTREIDSKFAKNDEICWKNCKNKNEKLTNIWVWSGAKEWESCRSRKMWKNAPTLALVAVDTAENGPPKVWRNWINYSVVSLVMIKWVRSNVKCDSVHKFD